MKKIVSLIKANMSEGMNLFRINTKKKNNFTKILLPIFILLILMGAMFSYSMMIMEQLEQINMQFVLLSLFIIVTSFLTIIEGIYKSGNLLFNCKDDNLLLSLPIKKSTVLFLRVFKFYVFELLYNSIFLLPAIILYAINMKPGVEYYIVSLIGLFAFPIVPIFISCIIGTFITFIASKFKGKNLMQTFLTMALLIVIMYFSYNSESLLVNISQNATSINDFITKLYYPAGAYIELITNYSAIKLLGFVAVHLAVFVVTIVLIGKVYFNINTGVKSIKRAKSNKKYIIKTSTPIQALIKKELSRFVNSPVFVTNAGFGLVLYILGCILAVIKFDYIANMFVQFGGTINIDFIKDYMPVILFGFICFASFMTSITSSMISLEGKSFTILKSLPIKPYTIINSKVLTAVLIMIPFILIGNIIVFVKFHFDLLSIILILIASIILPLLSETIGIMVNLKYPRMDAKNDTEVVKQSMSSAISVFIGMALLGVTVFLLYKALVANLGNHLIIIIFTGVFGMAYGALLMVLRRKCDKRWNDIVEVH